MPRLYRRSRTTPALIACLLALLVAACSSGGGTDTVDPDPSTADAASSDTEPDDGDDAAPGEPTAGGTFTYGGFGEVNGLDPIRNSGGASRGGIPGLALFDSLMRLDADDQPVPYLAESLETDDGSTWTMTLREGVRFHDGTPLNAEAVRFNLARHLDPENNSPHLPQVAAIQGMEVLDDLTIEFTLVAPQASFPALFTEVPGMIGSPTAIEALGEDFNLQPVGAGPFRFEDWVVDEQLTLVRNDDYWQEGLPYLDTFVHRPMPDVQTRFASVQSGDIDSTYAIGMFPELLAAQEDPGLNTQTYVGNGGNAMLLNTRVPPLDDVRVRRAIAHLLDYDAINQVRYQGQAPEDRGVFAPDSGWYDGVEYPDHDPEEAERLLADYLAETGQEEITLTVGALPDRQQFAELIQGMLDAEGISAEVETFDVAEFVPRVFGGDFEIAAWAMTHFADPDLSLFSSFHSSSRQNASGISVPELDAALEQGRTQLDPEVRAEAYAEVSRLLAEELPYVWTVRSVQSLVSDASVHGLDHYNDMRFLSAEIWLDR